MSFSRNADNKPESIITRQIPPSSTMVSAQAIIYDFPINNLSNARPFLVAEICVQSSPAASSKLFRMRADAARARFAESPDFRRSFAVVSKFGVYGVYPEGEQCAIPHRSKAVSHLPPHGPAVKWQNRAWIYDAIVYSRYRRNFSSTSAAVIHGLKLLISITNVRWNSIKNEASESVLLGKEVLRSNINQVKLI